MIVVFGSINLDLVFPLQALPVAGQTVIGPAMRVSPGGKGANQAVAAARDGARVAMIGAVGQDAFAAPALAALEASGVSLAHLGRADISTGVAAVCVDARGENQIAVAAGANLQARADAVPETLLGPDAILLMQMEVPPEEVAQAVRRAKARGARVVLNLAPALPLPEDVLRVLDVLVVNEDEAAWLGGHLGCGADAAAVQARLGIAVIRTLGADGVEIADGAGARRIAPRPVKPRDTTGAGDCFNGVLCAGLERGLDLDHAALRANQAAALCCLRDGAQDAMPTHDETEAALAA